MTDLIPADCLVAYVAEPVGGTAQASQPVGRTDQSGGSASAIATILTFLNAGGLIPDEGQVFADIAAALPLLGRFEHALTLIDVSSKVVRKDPTTQYGEGKPTASLRLKRLQAAVIFRTNGKHKAVLNQLNRIVGRYTNAEVARLNTEVLGDYRFQRLEDERLPGWAIWEWGRLGDYFVVSFGAGTFKAIIEVYSGAAPSLSEDEWFRSATVKTQGNQAMAQWFIALSRLEERLGRVAQGRHSRVISSLRADGMTHDLWTIGREGRALSWYRCYRRNGKDVTRRYSDPAAYPPDHCRFVPDETEHFAIIRVPTRWLVEDLPGAWLAAQSESHVAKWSKIWSRLEQETGIDINGSLAGNLGHNVILFDYPVHPLKIPFALTIAIEIDNRQEVEMAIDALLAAWGRYLDERAERKGTTLVRVKVLRAKDGIWYLQAGILGPALKVMDGYVVISWSPQALREVLKYFQQAGERPAKPSAAQSRPITSEAAST